MRALALNLHTISLLCLLLLTNVANSFYFTNLLCKNFCSSNEIILQNNDEAFPLTRLSSRQTPQIGCIGANIQSLGLWVVGRRTVKMTRV